jgi:hypothetical protein
MKNTARSLTLRSWTRTTRKRTRKAPNLIVLSGNPGKEKRRKKKKKKTMHSVHERERERKRERELSERQQVVERQGMVNIMEDKIWRRPGGGGRWRSITTIRGNGERR